ncbi:MAG: PEP-CTERM sorting domain-containing protein [Verrucomicrobiales bacterium]|nr:PEP-CTERM sorting domain-containing protein [Verrucomicrobiales bacterium]
MAPFFALFATAGPFFHYDPSKGNLLLDVTGLYVDSFLDGVSGDQPLSVWQRFGEKEGRLVNKGLVTGFNFVVPEPSGVGLLGLGAGLAVLAGLASSSKQKDSDVTS